MNSPKPTTSLTLPDKDYQDLQRAQHGGFSGNDPYWKKQSGKNGFITWALRVVFHLMRQDKFYPLLKEVKEKYQSKEET